MLGSGRLCERYRRNLATEVLSRHFSRYAELTRIDPSSPKVVLCRFCWLDIVYGLKGMPQGREAIGPRFLDPGGRTLIGQRQDATGLETDAGPTGGPIVAEKA